MTIRELIEASHLDALNLLEEGEQREFEAAFADAPENVRAHIRAEQEQVVRGAARFVDAEPPAELRERVLGAIRALMADEELLARGASSGAVLASIAPGAGVSARRGVASGWRAAGLGFGMAAAVLLGAFWYVADQNQQLARKYNSDSLLGGFSQAFSVQDFQRAMFDQSWQRRIFDRGPAGDPTARASLAYHPDSSRATLFVDGIRVGEGQDLRLCVVDETNAIVDELATFTTNGQPTAETIDHIAPRPGMRLAIVAARIGQRATGEAVLLVVQI